MGIIVGKNFWVKSGGTWKQTSYVKAKNSGSFVAAKQVWAKWQGSWVKVLDESPSLVLASQTVNGDSITATISVLTHGASTTFVSKKRDASFSPPKITDWGTVTPSTVTADEATVTLSGTGYGTDVPTLTYYVDATNSYGTTRLYI